MKRWFRAVIGLVVAAWVPVAGAKDLPNIDAFFDSPAPREDSLAKVRSSAKGALISGVEPRLGVPTFMWGNNAQVEERLRSALGRMSAEQAARVHLSRLAELYKLSPRAADTLPAVTQGSGKGPSLVTFRQSVDGVEVFRESLTLLLNERHELVSVSGYLSPHVPAAVSAGKLSFKLDAPSAIVLAFENLNGERLDTASLELVGKAQGPYSSFDFAPAARAQSSLRMVTPARAKRVFFPLTDGVVPAWYVELHTGPQGKPEADYYSYVISARDGRVLFRNNLTVADSYAYRVWAEGAPAFIPQDGPQGLAGSPHPTGLPDGYQAPFIAPSLVTLQNAPFSQNDPWLPPGATETVGNNVDAYADISGDDGLDGSDFRADTTAPNTFDRVYDVTLEPDASEDQIKASVTQLFYVNNFLHDWFYDAGFDEAAGNAQNDNLGRGGLEGDRINAEAQDISGFNNANMATPSDGEQPRMQMYLFSPNVEVSVTVLTPPAIAGTYEPGTAAFGPAAFDLSGSLVLVQDAGGASPTDGCEVPFANAAQVAGNIAVIDRGTCGFVVKAKNAQDAGAVGVLIVNNAAGPAPGMGGSDPTITIPTLSLAQDDGALIKTELANGPVTARMYAESAVFRDGALDNAIIAHEWGHYISNRLIADANGLVNNQGRSMGEGWGDFTALLMMVREADRQAAGNNNFQGAYTAGGYVSSGSDNNGYYFGVRRYPYSTDFTRNPLTFKHIQDSAQLPTNVPSNPDLFGIENSEVHTSGEVWATMLWECYTALLRDRPRLTFAQAQERMKKYLVLAYKVTPPAPTFIEARDALLASAYSFDPEDFRLLHAAFARRGAGLRAEGPRRGSRDHEGVVESFVTGKDVRLAEVELVSSGSCDNDGVLDNKEAGILRVTVVNTGTDTLTQTTATVSTTAQGVTLANGGLLTFPPIQPFDSGVAEVSVALDGPASIRVVDFNVTYRDAKQAIPGDLTGTFSMRVNTDDVPNASASDDVESNIVAWASERDENLDEYIPWLRDDEAPDAHYYFGVDAPTLTDIYLVSPPLQVSATGSFGFSFVHRYAFEEDVDQDTGAPLYFDGAVIELSNDGGQTWTDIGASLGAGQGYTGTITEGGLNPLENRMAFTGASEDYPAWHQAVVDLGTAYQGQVVQIRFRVGTDVSAGAIGWDVDEVSFNGITNTPFPVLVVEQNPCSGNTPPVVNAGPDQTVDESATVALNGTATDADGNTLELSWIQTAGPSVELSGSNTRTPGFVAPPVSANTVLSFQFTANDGQAFATDTVSITVRNSVNVAPVANAGPDQTVNEGTLVILDGGGSADPDGDPLTYAWVQTAGTPQVTLTGANTEQPAFTAPNVTADALLTFRLTVSDGTLSQTDTVVITVRDTSQNRPPVANAGPDQAVDEGLSVTLDGRGSSDPDQGTTLRYSWTQTAGPPAALTGANTAQPAFRAPNVTADAVLTFTLTVSDGLLSSSDTVAITVRNVAQNRSPVANAGPDQTVNEGTAVMLDGRGSFDPDGDPLTYAWVQTAGPAVTLTGASSAQPTFTAPAVTANTVLTFTLTVSDGPLSQTDTVSITVRDAAQNRAPVANAGPDQVVDENTPAMLDGRGSSDPDNNTLSYAWSQTGGTPTVTLTGANTAQPTFTAPNVTANTVLTFTLTVSDGLLSHTDTVVVTVRNVVLNRAPAANAGPDQTVDEDAGVQLNGSGSSDPDAGTTLIYAWTQTQGPTVTLVGANTAQPTFTAPSVTADTVLRFSLTVSDGTLSSTDTVNITVRNVVRNRAPVADAGPDQTVDERTAVTLNGSGSSDPDTGTTLTYTWAQTAGPAVTLTNGTSAQPSFTAPEVTADTVLTFTLTVSDGALNSTDTVNITVRNVVAQNRPPVANAGADQTVEEGATATLRGSATDPEGDTLTYAWTQTAGPDVTLNNANAAMATFTAPDVAADTVLTFTLKVTDPGGASAEDSLNVTVTAKTGGGDGGDGAGGGCGCSSDSSAAGSLMPLLMIGMALLSRRRQWLR